MKSQSESYKEAGVDITSGYRAVELMKEHVSKTMVFGNTSPVGGFGGLLQPDLTGMEEPILVSGTDGVGTKLKLAFLQDKHDTVGLDCVAMCVNDIICVGAKPLFFLDYIAVGKNVPEKVASIVKGVAEGCIQSECCLIGGETAEMPGISGRTIMNEVKILEPYEYIRNETPEEFEDEEKNERWADRIDGAGMYIGGGLGTLLMVATILWGIVTAV